MRGEGRRECVREKEGEGVRVRKCRGWDMEMTLEIEKDGKCVCGCIQVKWSQY